MNTSKKLSNNDTWESLKYYMCPILVAKGKSKTCLAAFLSRICYPAMQDTFIGIGYRHLKMGFLTSGPK